MKRLSESRTPPARPTRGAGGATKRVSSRLPTDRALAELCEESYSVPDAKFEFRGSGDERATLRKVGRFMVVTNRGTVLDGVDILRDIRFLPRRFEWGWAPAGFGQGAAALLAQILARCADAARERALVFNGHSLGGAEAENQAAAFVALGLPVADVCAFDPPRSMGWRTAWRLRRAVPRARRYVLGSSPVGDLPPPFPWAQHPSYLIQLGERRPLAWRATHLEEAIRDHRIAAIRAALPDA